MTDIDTPLDPVLGERLHAIHAIWSWLPTFRVVAETQHVAKAAELLRVSPPAVSRTLKLLEDHIGVELFSRAGRQLVLNNTGQMLLQHVRNAMGSVHEGVAMTRGEQLAGALSISTVDALAPTYLLPAIEALRREHPAIVPYVHGYTPEECVARLRWGSVDVGVYYGLPRYTDVLVERLCVTTSAIYCGRSHPLFNQRDISPNDWRAHAFVALSPELRYAANDGWPPDAPRTLGLHVHQLNVALEACLSGRYLAVLSDVTAHARLASGELRRIPFAALKPATLYSMRRVRPAGPDRAGAFQRALKAHIEGVVSDIAALS